jgi:hypothetical protein
MARAHLKTKNKAGQPYNCCRCAGKIVAGEKYYEWKFRYGGQYRQHASHGSPKQSQLTQSKMSGVYAAVETAEDNIDQADCAADIAAALNDCASGVGDVRDEYQSGIDNMPEGLQQGSVAQESQEKIDALQEFCDNLESVASEIESESEPEETENDETLDEVKADWLEGLRQQAHDALAELSI